VLHVALYFYINSIFQWAVELVRESDRLTEHFERFSTTGIFKDIPIQDYVLLNFVNKPQMGEGDHGKRMNFRKPKNQKEMRVYHARGCPELKVCTSDSKKPFSVQLLAD
jgi:hypothetical protein